MHDTNKRRIALVKAKIAELEEWETKDTQTHHARVNTRIEQNSLERDCDEHEKTEGEQGDAHTKTEANSNVNENSHQRKRKATHKVEERQAKVRLTDSRKIQIQQQPPPCEDPGGNMHT